MVSSELALHRYATGRESHVVTALTTLKSRLFWFLLMDPDTLSFATMGSGALAAMCVFESR
ncbi:proteasome subunit beta type-7-B-like [Physcomitrium patens]|uniref:proteasome subunit beta type-7-B-like n=1 Tax=Physcomitrium patens TaxID=3218 RepID=UPI003CCDC28C